MSAINSTANGDAAQAFKTMVSKRENLQHLGGMSEASSEGTTHSVRQEEQVAFSDWINTKLRDDLDLKHVLPLDRNGNNLYEAIKDGILLCKIINLSCPDTIDERSIKKKNLTLYTKHENLTLALKSAQAIGCSIVNIDAHDLTKGSPHLVLGLLWQIIRIGIFNQINLDNCPGLINLVDSDTEGLEDLMKLTPENILLRWVNFHLEKAGVARRIKNFTKDISDSEVYTRLLYQIAPKSADISTEALYIRDMLQRAEIMLRQADKLGCRSFLTPRDVVGGSYKLNVAFLANLFNKYPALDVNSDAAQAFKAMLSKRENLQQLGGMSEASSEGTTHSYLHEEQVAFSDWINSKLSNDPDLKHVLPLDSNGENLYEAIKDGILLCKIINFSCPKTIEERSINKKNLTLYTKHENLTLALKSAQTIGCNIVNIDAHDLAKGSPHLVLGLLWQIIRAGIFNRINLEHCPGLVNLVNGNIDELRVLTPETILQRWVNYHLDKAGITRQIKNFTKDISDSEVYTHLLYQIAPKSLDVTMEALKIGDLFQRAEIMLQQADKLGCRTFLAPRDVVGGFYKLNVAFLANLFNKYPAL